MLLPLDSHIRNPPKLLAPQQVIAFNGIRYCIDICEISRCRLYRSLSELTEKDVIEPLDFPEIFLDVWSIINNSQMFGKLICKEFQIERKEPGLEEFNKAILFRDSNQHLEERISKDRSLSDLPIFGFLSWRKIFKDSDSFSLSTIYSGTFTNKTKVKMQISNETVKELHPFIQKIEFTNVVRVKDKNKSWIFKEEKISISRILSDLKDWIEHFEQFISEQLKKVDTSEKHQSDLIITMPLKYFGQYGHKKV
jgi:hypothetical protein